MNNQPRLERQNGIIVPNLEDFRLEKKAIIKSNKNRVFKSSIISPAISNTERSAFVNIILNYERARDYLSWFLPFKRGKNILDFNINNFKSNGKPILVLAKTIANKRGSDMIKRGADGKIYKIPEQYIRLANSVFPNWFKELCIIDKVMVFPEFSDDKNLWHMFYPIKISDEDFLNKDIEKILKRTFLKKLNKRSVWIPYLVYILVSQYGCSVRAVKLALEKVYKEYYEQFYLERTSLSLMKRHSQYKDSYVKIDGFYRSSLIITKRSYNNG